MTDKKQENQEYQIIDEIPGEDGWWKSATREKYASIAKKLLAYGINPESISEMLNDCYWAAAGDFGG